MPLVSIVVPVYNVEGYLSKCVKSLTEQTLKNIEIILIDDGSSDDSGEICDRLQMNDTRIKVIHKSNGGLSSARNAGLNIATGEYIGFVDSDDDIELDMYEKLYAVAKSKNVDFVMTDYLRITRDGKHHLKTADIRAGYYCKTDIVQEIFPNLIMRECVDYGPILSVWNCLYRTQFLKENKISFDEKVRWSEDNLFNSIVGYCANSFYYMQGEGLYHYYENPGTITTSYRNGAWEVYCIMNQRLHEFFDIVEDYDFRRQLKLHMIYYACNCIGQEIGQPSNNAKSMIKNILNSKQLKEAFSKFSMPKVNYKLKLQLYLMRWRQAKLLFLLRK